MKAKKVFQDPSASLIITSYNQAKTLERLLLSLRRQTRFDFEVLVADDGSQDETRSVCRTCQEDPSCPFSLVFCTQPDEGYRKSKILNEAIRQTQTAYCIFLDGDTVVHPQFVEDHLALKRSNAFVCGRRVDLSPSFSAKMTKDHIQSGFFDSFSFSLFWDGVFGQTQHWKRSIRVAHPLLRKGMGYERPIDLLGSNFSVFKKDLLAVNGFNEALQSYWGEDGDLYIRLRNSGKKPINAKGMAIQYHVFHARRELTSEHVTWYEERLKDPQYRWAERGILQGSIPRR